MRYLVTIVVSKHFLFFYVYNKIIIPQKSIFLLTFRYKRRWIGTYKT